jgi:aminopeptidase
MPVGSRPVSPGLHTACLTALRDCLGLRPEESVLIVSDEPMRAIAYALQEAARDLAREVLLVEMLPRSGNGEEPPAQVAQLMKMFDVVLCPASTSLTHTGARREASAAGARIATLPNVTEEVLIRCMNADYGRIAERTFVLCRMLDSTDVVRVRAPGGTDLTLPKRGRKAFASSGLFREKGEFGNLPTGEAFLAPLEGMSSGVAVIDGSIAMIGMVRQKVTITVEGGYATDIAGGEEAERLVELFSRHGREARNVAEFGIGTNHKAILSGLILEDEKVMGTVHVAFGDNKSMGGKIGVASHLDGLITKPTVWFDDRLIMAEGRFVVTV